VGGGILVVGWLGGEWKEVDVGFGDGGLLWVVFERDRGEKSNCFGEELRLFNDEKR